MTTLAKLIVGSAFISLCGSAIFSQSASSAANAPQVRRITSMYGVSNIEGQPFSADLEIEHNQTLLDGSHIHTVQHMKFFRDGEGRIRYESYQRRGPYQQGPEELSSVTIMDITANAQYSLLPRNHSARRSAMFARQIPAPAVPRPAPIPAQQAQPQPKSTNEALGVQTIEGISAEGSRFTMTLPVNFQGNDAPLTYSNETWYSTEMGLEILLKMNDPRTGERVQRFLNIQRGEPDPSLFQVPADYTIKDAQ